eukprot:TRINITY_DN11460_c0_g1_i1.p1 TRINITY_DN11460_c0_g1~~TRINITY_DN11460_c0_g1_i1.p1  ORF type:complete len:381 (+),score=88.79 TRINITY_DN11460_c0_g1_i1:57-1145(+)
MADDRALLELEELRAEFKRGSQLVHDCRRSTRRTAVSAEAFGPWAAQRAESSGSQVTYEKSARTRRLLARALQAAGPPLGPYLKEIGEEHFQNIVDAFVPHQVKSRSVVIHQGDLVGKTEPGLFVLEAGLLQAWQRTPEKEEEEILLRTYGSPGDIFGELGVLHQAPRAATVEAKEDSKLWSVSRAVVFEAKRSFQEWKRKTYDDILRSVELLSPLDAEARAQVIDNLRSNFYKQGEEIIRQGEEGHEFFLLVKGEAIALKDGEEVSRYRPGSCFGELALLSASPRAATVRACTNCETAVLSEADFSRLLGPLSTMQNQKISHRQRGGQRQQASFKVISMLVDGEEDDEEEDEGYGCDMHER